MAAGALLIGPLVVCAALGFGLGSLVGAAVPLGVVGLFVGFFAGLGLVYARFRDL
jgi:hypothetical protein